MGAPHRALGLQPEGPPGCGERQEGNCPPPVSGVGGRVLRPPLPRAREPQDCTAGVSPGLPHPAALAPFHPFPAKSPGLRGAFGAEGGLGAGPLPTQGRPMGGTHMARPPLNAGLCKRPVSAASCCVTSRIYRTPFPSSGTLVSTVGRGRTPTELSTGPARRRQRLWGGPGARRLHNLRAELRAPGEVEQLSPRPPSHLLSPFTLSPRGRPRSASRRRKSEAPGGRNMPQVTARQSCPGNRAVAGLSGAQQGSVPGSAPPPLACLLISEVQ